MKRILDEDGPSIHTFNELRKRFDRCLNLNTSEKLNLEGWRERTFQVVKKRETPLYKFVAEKFKQQPKPGGGPWGARPEEPVKPPDPQTGVDPEAAKAAQKKHAEAMAKYNAEFAKYQAWEDGLANELQSPLWLVKFLADVPAVEEVDENKQGGKKPDANNDEKSVNGARDLARVLLGIDALLALDGPEKAKSEERDTKKTEIKNKCKGIALDSIVTAHLDLEWKWPADDEEPIRVRRFEIKPGEQAVKAPQLSDTPE
ncbi:MAG: hypothetical protein ACKO6B_18060 [Planctomycetia bacterium]